jgi:hypothetical protein
MKLGLYRHYKGKLYQVIGIARHSEALEELVIYQALYGNYSLWARPKSMFFEHVNYQGTLVDRFLYLSGGITEPAEIAVPG